MKKYLQKGFTLIELLVVITLIAILAVAILAAINPVEMRKKAVDTGINSGAAQLISAYDRFYTGYGCFPGQYTSTATPPCAAMPTPGPLSSIDSDVTKMKTAGEIKDASLATRLNGANAPTHYLYLDGDAVMHYCYMPQSKNFKALSKFTTALGAGTEYYCIPDSQGQSN